MVDPFERDWWNGVQAVAWVAFRDPDKVRALSNNEAATLREMLKAETVALATRYRGKHPEQALLGELEDALKSGQVKWTYILEHNAGSPGKAPAFHLKLSAEDGLVGIPARGDCDKPKWLTNLGFKRADMVARWTPTLSADADARGGV